MSGLGPSRRGRLLPVEIASVTPAGKKTEIAAVGATAGVGFLGAGELEGELELVGGRFGGELVVIGAEADREARIGSDISHYRMQSVLADEEQP
jgi:hypothetical protein